ncbi:hypothetical protein [Afipia sp. Root123D2]|uniref:hypothetical protein n=1 Tax=Afipia sp. Root123D2 TaxID=1736436 RepID=UPI0012E7B4F5|nr:hypothetical protein [Afipia sp. Root123D2]
MSDQCGLLQGAGKLEQLLLLRELKRTEPIAALEHQRPFFIRNLDANASGPVGTEGCQKSTVIVGLPCFLARGKVLIGENTSFAHERQAALALILEMPVIAEVKLKPVDRCRRRQQNWERLPRPPANRQCLRMQYPLRI